MSGASDAGRSDVRVAGFGGQGIILAGYLLGKAASLYDGKEAVLTQAYGPEARGGACNADVVISPETIGFPEIEAPNVIALMSQEAADSYLPTATADATVLVDEDLVHVDRDGPVHTVPATRIADELGRRIVANMVMLGFVSAVTKVVSPDALKEAIRTTVRPNLVDLNLRAFEAGYARGGAA